MPETQNGSERWRTSAWESLLRSAVNLLEALHEQPRVIFGGGTALAVHYHHRISYDVDLFVTDANVLRDLTPARNPATKRLLDGRKYEYPGSYLKLHLDVGEIDFILAASRTDDPCQAWSFDGRPLQIETPWETAIKKIFYRPSTFKVRDVFDLAAVIARNPTELRSSLDSVEDKLDKLEDRVKRIAPSYAELAANDISPTLSGAIYARAEAALNVLDFVQAFRKEAGTEPSATEPR